MSTSFCPSSYIWRPFNSIDNDDTLTIYIESSDYTDGIVDNLGLKFENGDITELTYSCSNCHGNYSDHGTQVASLMVGDTIGIASNYPLVHCTVCDNLGYCVDEDIEELSEPFGLLSKIIKLLTIQNEESYSAYRFWLASCVEG